MRLNQAALIGMATALTLSSCATMSNRTKTILAMVGTGLVAGAIGAATAPKDEQPGGHALMWGGLGAASAGVVGLFAFNEEAKREEADRKLEVLTKELSSLRDEGSSEPTLLFQTNAPLGKDPPPEYRNLITPGKWSVYRLNRWVTEGENTLIHQDRMVRMIPPVLSPKEPKETQNE